MTVGVWFISRQSVILSGVNNLSKTNYVARVFTVCFIEFEDGANFLFIYIFC